MAEINIKRKPRHVKGEDKRSEGLYKYPNMILFPSNSSKFRHVSPTVNSTRAEILLDCVYSSNTYSSTCHRLGV